tara:strand:+ start:566 stop:904 length:339 start_codon:yes stop_codon:yes gene_type:complete
MSNQSRCPIFNTNILDENECIFVWELTVPTSKTEDIKKKLADAGFNLDYVDITNDSGTTIFEMTLSEDAHQDWEDALHEEGWVEQGDYDLDRDDEDYLNLPSIVRETIEAQD